MSWGNFDNQDFYQELQAQGLENYANMAGLASGCDLAFLQEYWKNANCILDVGCGYGRAIDYLLKSNVFKGEIIGIERCEAFLEFLTKKYLTQHKVKILKIDVHDPLPFDQKFDVILWLWSGIADFAATEQLSIVCNLAKNLEKSGTFIIDTLPEKVTPVLAQEKSSQYFTTSLDNSTVHTYEPTKRQVFDYAKKAGFKNISRKICKTDIGRERALYILRF